MWGRKPSACAGVYPSTIIDSITWRTPGIVIWLSRDILTGTSDSIEGGCRKCEAAGRACVQGWRTPWSVGSCLSHTSYCWCQRVSQHVAPRGGAGAARPSWCVSPPRGVPRNSERERGPGNATWETARTQLDLYTTWSLWSPSLRRHQRNILCPAHRAPWLPVRDCSDSIEGGPWTDGHRQTGVNLKAVSCFLGYPNLNQWRWFQGEGGTIEGIYPPHPPFCEGARRPSKEGWTNL